ncbi:hypothetical protein GGR55DRAFT_663527 [Xylaria sp. FL0064]|nr:hypothetical protein GGR55DRAFT_663527 [Xylaria sp. FL0064]
MAVSSHTSHPLSNQHSHIKMRPAILPLFMAALATADLPTPDLDPPKATPVLLPTPNLHVLIAVETFHQDTGNGAHLTNTTISVPVGPPYRNASALNAVTTLYTLGSESVSCIPYLSEIPIGSHGNPFTFRHPAELAQNDTVLVGSIVCTQSH